MAAVTAALLSYLKAGDHVVAARAMFGSCRYIVETLCPRFGIAATLIDGRDLDAWRAAVQPNTKMLLFRDARQPDARPRRHRRRRQIAKERGIMSIVDNVFATPMLQRPLQHGADIVVYSATKHIDGQGRCLGGAVLCSRRIPDKHLQDFIRQTGPS